MARTGRVPLWPEPFDPDAEYVARKDIRIRNEPVRAGTPIDRTTLSDRRLRQLYDARMVVRAELVPSDRRQQPREVQQVVDKGPSRELRIQHRGGGRWWVMDGDLLVSGPWTKEEAEARLHQE